MAAKDSLLKFLILILAVVLLLEFVERVEQPLDITYFRADKYRYVGKDNVVLDLGIYSRDNVQAELWVHGIHAKTDRIDDKRKIHLSSGMNTLSYKYRLPACTGCARIDVGKYNVSAEVTLAQDLKDTDVVYIQIDKKQGFE